jgi:hypothetical protein
MIALRTPLHLPAVYLNGVSGPLSASIIEITLSLRVVRVASITDTTEKKYRVSELLTALVDGVYSYQRAYKRRSQPRCSCVCPAPLQAHAHLSSRLSE